MVGKLDQQWLDRQPSLKHALLSTSTALADCVSEVQRLTETERRLQQDLLQARSRYLPEHRGGLTSCHVRNILPRTMRNHAAG